MFHIFGTVKKLKIFEGIDDTIVQQILDQAERVEFWPGTIILEQGQASNGKGYIIEEWIVDVWVNGVSSAKLSVGDIFWEIALLNEEERTATIVSETPVRAIVLSQKILFTMIENDNNLINKEIIRRIEQNIENE